MWTAWRVARLAQLAFVPLFICSIPKYIYYHRYLIAQISGGLDPSRTSVLFTARIAEALIVSLLFSRLALAPAFLHTVLFLLFRISGWCEEPRTRKENTKVVIVLNV